MLKLEQILTAILVNNSLTERVCTVLNYKELYYHLFLEVEKAIRLLDLGETQKARAQLIEAQQSAEELYLSQTDE